MPCRAASHLLSKCLRGCSSARQGHDEDEDIEVSSGRPPHEPSVRGGFHFGARNGTGF